MEPANVLIVEGEEIGRTMMSGLLARRGFCVCSASNGADAMHILKSIICDLVIVDIVMPDKDGKEFLAELKEEFPTTRIVAISSSIRALNRIDTPDIPTLEKPFEIDALMAAIESVIPQQNHVTGSAVHQRSR